LTPDNVEQHLAGIRAARQAYWDRGSAPLARVGDVFVRTTRANGLPAF
jgi:hypothetical protein